MSTSLETAKWIARLADEKKGENIVIMEMSRLSGVCDYFVIISASSNVRARTIAEYIKTEGKHEGLDLVHQEGLREGRWALLDFSDVVVHVFQDEVRRYYALEQLWGDAPRFNFSEMKSGQTRDA